MRRINFFFPFLAWAATWGGGWGIAAEMPATEQQARPFAQKTMNDGNFNDAYQMFHKLATEPKSDPRQVGSDVGQATQCLQRLNRLDEIDAFYEAVVAAHAEQWRVLWAMAEHYMNVPHQGFIVAGEFSRGPKRGGQGGTPVNSVERDRVRALQLMAQAWPLARQDDDHASVGNYLLAMGRILLNNRGFHESWRLQYLTDLGELPDYDEGWGYYGQTLGAPVDEDGKPVLHPTPRSLDEAETDGQRWRWCLEQAIEFNPRQMNAVRSHFADFLLNQFGVQTMAHFGFRFGRAADDGREDESGTWALHTLGEKETIARLATGVKRFELPDEFNFIKIYQQIADQPQTGHGEAAIRQLAQIFENRRQYPKAAETWRRLIDEYPSLGQYRDRLSQIVDNWGQFEPITTQPAGQGATVEYRFRNGHLVELKARAIKVEQLLQDVKDYLKSNPGQVDWQKANIGDIGHRLVRQNEEKYLGDQVAQWTMVVNPRTEHFDKRVTVTTPLQTPGAYLLEATMKGGNTSYIILWVADMAIVRKPLEGKNYYYVADAVTGAPVAKANVEFFGWRVEHRGQPGRPTPRDFRVDVKQFAENTDADGQLLIDQSRAPSEYQWLLTARAGEKRFAYLGFSGVWYAGMHDPDYRATKVFPITDRPVYRPEQTVHFKFWVRHAQYDQDEVSQFAGQSFTVEIHDGRQEKVLEKTYEADEYGGFEGELELPKDATLGQYGMMVRQGNRHFGGGNFRVEEYKKPEFEVTIDAPSEPVMLGEVIEAKINARYYFGSPVTSAKVKYKVMRTPHTQPWYPPMPWDWFYGPGYWWFGYDYPWYPGWRHWGCIRPVPTWWPQRHAPPELVAEQEVEIGEDGTVSVTIDTSLAKALHGDQNHRYEITAEVTDQSRRTIVGTGEVLVAREAFKVHTWVDRGYYRIGDTVRASFQARRIDGKPVEGEGELTLYRIGYKDGQPVETPVQNWQVHTGVDGRAAQQLTASQAGQYRLSYKVTDAKDHVIEGGYLFTIIGEGFDSAQFRFNHLELIPDKQDYAPGDKVKLQINTDRAGGTVLLFVRPTNGVYLKPEVLRLDGKSTIHEIEVAKRDMPNFFVEAVTLAGARVHTEMKEIVVPPEKRVLGVAIEPSKEAYKPGEKAKVQLTLTDFTGEPFVGSAVVTIYDKSVEYISGGSNVPEIKEFFWKWRRSHHPSDENSLARWAHNLIREGAKAMSHIGVFGATVAEEMDGLEEAEGGMAVAKSGRRTFATADGFGVGGGGGMEMNGAAFGAPVRAMRAEAAMAPGAPMEDAMVMTEAADPFGADPGAGPMAEATVRTEFADTALWVGAVTTAKDGTAEVELDMPENLTTWRIKVWGMGHGTRVGEGFADVVTRKDLILRLQSPRFFVQSDEVVLSANVHNYLAAKKQVQVKLELEGDVLEPLDAGGLTQTVEIEPNAEQRIDWRVKVLDEGEATVRMFALTDEESDAMEMKFPSFIHGMLKMEARSGVIRPDQDRAEMAFTVPAERRPEQSRLEVRYSPTLAGAMVDALPYLVEYPYGCTEQTLNRFLPTVITQKILIDMGLDLEAVRTKRANLNAQELDDPDDRAQQWKRYDRNPVFDPEEVRRMVADGVARLTEMQLGDGGWGWFSGYGERSYPHTTAVVVHGLQVARQNDVSLQPGMLEKGVEWLRRYQAEQVQLIKNALIEKKPPGLRWKNYADNLDALVYMVLVDAGMVDAEMNEFLYRDRTRLAVYSLAMYGVALHEQGDQEAKLDMVLRNISQYVQQDDENQTAWLNLPGGFWWHWYGSEYEAHAYFLKLLSRTDPKGELAPRLVKYLLNNRKHATYWNSTRDTALCIEAMAEFLRASGEDKPEMTVQVYVGGELKKAVEITPQTLFQFDDRFILEAEDVPAGPLNIELRREGVGPVYFNGYLTNFTLEEFITKAGLEIKVEREYYKLVRVDATQKAAGSRGQVVDQKVEQYERQKLDNLDTLQSGDLVEIELVIESKNDYEYLVFEDMKPAGFEPVDLRSGYTGNPLGAYVEFRDERVVMFVRRLARGKHSTSYRMRAEIPGKFSALPTKAWAMYAPELKANSDEIKLNVED